MAIKLIDFGLVVLIWLVQLVVYPSFKYYQPDDLLRWHSHYTSAITVIVLPLMFGQLILHALNVYNGFSLLSMLIFTLVLGTWLVTFVWAVPLHNRITGQNDLASAVSTLISINWIRTILWTLVFLLGFIDFQKSPWPGH